MNKAVLLKWTNLVLFLSASVQALTGIILFFDLFMSRARLFDFIVKAHRYNGMLFIVLIAAHLWLNLGWVKAQLFRKGARP